MEHPEEKRRVPGYKKLQDEMKTEDIVFQNTTEEYEITVYRNGFGVFQKTEHKNISPRRTVMDINRINFNEKSVIENLVIPQEMIESWDANMVLVIYGEDRISHNGDAKEEEHIEVHVASDDEAFYGIFSVSDNTQEAVHKIFCQQRHKIIQGALDQLTPAQREMIQKYYYEKKSLTKTAEELGIAHYSVTSRHDGALKKLKILLQNQRHQLLI